MGYRGDGGARTHRVLVRGPAENQLDLVLFRRTVEAEDQKGWRETSFSCGAAYWPRPEPLLH